MKYNHYTTGSSNSHHSIRTKQAAIFQNLLSNPRTNKKEINCRFTSVSHIPTKFPDVCHGLLWIWCPENGALQTQIENNCWTMESNSKGVVQNTPFNTAKSIVIMGIAVQNDNKQYGYITPYPTSISSNVQIWYLHMHIANFNY